jgi:hypothetical protein
MWGAPGVANNLSLRATRHPDGVTSYPIWHEIGGRPNST